MSVGNPKVYRIPPYRKCSALRGLTDSCSEPFFLSIVGSSSRCSGDKPFWWLLISRPLVALIMVASRVSYLSTPPRSATSGFPASNTKSQQSRPWEYSFTSPGSVQSCENLRRSLHHSLHSGVRQAIGQSNITRQSTTPCYPPVFSKEDAVRRGLSTSRVPK